MYKKIYDLYENTDGDIRQRAAAIYNEIHNNPEYGRFAECPLDWLEHVIETGQIKLWKNR